MAFRRAVRAMLLALVAGACLIGADFSRPDPASLKLGETTEQEIRQRFGEPAGQASTTVDGKVITILRYGHAEPRSTAILFRAMAYTFHGGRLVGYDHTSSFQGDQTSFDESAATRIKRGETGRAEVLALVGQPTGEFIYPSPHANRPDHRAYVYTVAQRNVVAATNTLATTSKVLAIVFDPRDVVFQTSLVIAVSATPSK
jgi:outer membrane protein assembly factor BamE (lipoprotein component of BamABCDE complex)